MTLRIDCSLLQRQACKQQQYSLCGSLCFQSDSTTGLISCVTIQQMIAKLRHFSLSTSSMVVTSDTTQHSPKDQKFSRWMTSMVCLRHIFLYLPHLLTSCNPTNKQYVDPTTSTRGDCTNQVFSIDNITKRCGLRSFQERP